MNAVDLDNTALEDAQKLGEEGAIIICDNGNTYMIIEDNEANK